MVERKRGVLSSKRLYKINIFSKLLANHFSECNQFTSVYGQMEVKSAVGWQALTLIDSRAKGLTNSKSVIALDS